MLPARHRLRRSDDFSATVRGRGRRRAGGPLLVVHAATRPEPGDGAVRVGFVVGSTVGGAVVRNRVRRRLRALMAQRLDGIPRGTDLVVRAVPAAAEASFAELSAELSTHLARVASPTAAVTSAGSSV
ncbi:MAG: ribonuclease P protein component [Dermatophilaceae bacterium]